MAVFSPRVLFRVLLSVGCLAAALTISAHAQAGTPTAAATVPALLLSDIHLDPYHDPAKVSRLDATPASGWAAILREPDSPGQAEAYAALNKSCPVRGIDTSDVLWRSSLGAIRQQAALAKPRFVTISGDLLAHQFDCKYRTLLPSASKEQSAAFAEKAIRYLMSSVEAAVPGAPVYLALGNNDSACKDYELNPQHDALLAYTARLAAETLPEAERAGVISSYARLGAFSAAMAGVPRARIIVLDDVYLSTRYTDCSGAKDAGPAAAQIAWLRAELAQARARQERVWVVGHIPPGVDIYTTARAMTNVCGGVPPVMFLSSTELGETLEAYPQTVRLALFGHTHSDEMALLRRGSEPAGVPVKLVPSITAVNGNRPTFTIARIDPRTADLKNYTVFESSNLTGVEATWSAEYTFSSAYGVPEYDGRSVQKLIESFQGDPGAELPASRAYLRDYYPGDLSSLLQLAWPEYTCGMDHTEPEEFVRCICRKPSP